MLSSRLVSSSSRQCIGTLTTTRSTVRSSKLVGSVLRKQQQQSRQLSLRPALGFWTPSSNERKENNTDARLCISLPFITISIPPTSQRRCMSTTTPKSDESKSNSLGNLEDASEMDDPPPTPILINTTATATGEDAFEAERRSMRERIQERAGKMGTSARESYDEFRQHPGQSALSGAKTAGEMLRMYGPVFVGTYLTIYVSTLGMLYGGVQSGALDPVALFGWLGQDTGECKNTVDLVVDFMQKHTITQPYAPSVEKHPYLANLAVAWIATKFTEPIRLAVALPLTPRVARYLGYGPKVPVETEASEAEAAASTASMPDQAEASTSKTPAPK